MIFAIPLSAKIAICIIYTLLYGIVFLISLINFEKMFEAICKGIKFVMQYLWQQLSIYAILNIVFFVLLFTVLLRIIRYKNKIIPYLSQKQFIKNHQKQTRFFQQNQETLNNEFKLICKHKLSMIIDSGQDLYITKPFNLYGYLSHRKYLYNISFTTSDQYGGWSAVGYLGYSAKGISIWLSKSFDEKENDKKSENEKMIFQGQSTDKSIANIKGKWYKLDKNDELFCSDYWDFTVDQTH